MRGQEIDAALLAANTDPSRIPPNCEAGGLQLTDGTVAISARPAPLVNCPEPKTTSHCQIRDCLRTTLGCLLAQNKIPPSISHGFHKRGRERNPTKNKQKFHQIQRATQFPKPAYASIFKLFSPISRLPRSKSTPPLPTSNPKTKTDGTQKEEGIHPLQETYS